MFQGKSQFSVVDIRLVQLTIFKVCLHLEVMKWVYDITKDARFTGKKDLSVDSVKCHARKGFATGCLPKHSGPDSQTGVWVVVCVNPIAQIYSLQGCLPTQRGSASILARAPGLTKGLEDTKP